MLKISRLADYSAVLMSFLALYPEQFFSATTLSQRTGIAVPTVSKVLKLLLEASLLHSTRGTNGGYQLARDASMISVAEIIFAIDGKPAVTQCCDAQMSCVHDQGCSLRGNWQYINDSIIQMLSKMTLAQMQRPLQREMPLSFHRFQQQGKSHVE